jgi:acetylornithine deacetylase/succinyl-diaminopimelate desuccinylase-like protein
MRRVLDIIESRQEIYINRLADIVTIKSVSGELEYRDECIRMATYTSHLIQEIIPKSTVHLYKPGEHVLDGVTVKIPPIVYGTIGNRPNKKTLLVYGHLDVQPAIGVWNTEPFKLTIDGDVMYGRGTTDDKGPILTILHALEAYYLCGLEPPVNVKFIFEVMEESGSDGLDDLIQELSAVGWFNDIHCCCVCDTYMIDEKTPCVSHGLKGCCHFTVEITGMGMQLHSGKYGGMLYEPRDDMCVILSSLKDRENTIAIPGLYDLIDMNYADKRKLPDISLDLDNICKGLGVAYTACTDAKDFMYRNWMLPSLSLHGSNTYTASGISTIIPNRVTERFSIRTVMGMDSHSVERIVIKHVEDVFNGLESPNTLSIQMDSGDDPWCGDTSHPQYRAGIDALKSIYNADVATIQEGGSIPFVTMIQRCDPNMSIMLLPVGRSSDNPHSPNEKLNISNYIRGTCVFAQFLYNLA